MVHALWLLPAAILLAVYAVERSRKQQMKVDVGSNPQASQGRANAHQDAHQDAHQASVASKQRTAEVYANMRRQYDALVKLIDCSSFGASELWFRMELLDVADVERTAKVLHAAIDRAVEDADLRSLHYAQEELHHIKWSIRDLLLSHKTTDETSPALLNGWPLYLGETVTNAIVAGMHQSEDETATREFCKAVVNHVATIASRGIIRSIALGQNDAQQVIEGTEMVSRILKAMNSMLTIYTASRRIDIQDHLVHGVMLAIDAGTETTAAYEKAVSRALIQRLHKLYDEDYHDEVEQDSIELGNFVNSMLPTVPVSNTGTAATGIVKTIIRKLTTTGYEAHNEDLQRVIGKALEYEVGLAEPLPDSDYNAAAEAHFKGDTEVGGTLALNTGADEVDEAEVVDQVDPPASPDPLAHKLVEVLREPEIDQERMLPLLIAALQQGSQVDDVLAKITGEALIASLVSAQQPGTVNSPFAASSEDIVASNLSKSLNTALKSVGADDNEVLEFQQRIIAALDEYLK